MGNIYVYENVRIYTVVSRGNSTRYFPEPTLSYSLHNVIFNIVICNHKVILVLEVGDHTFLQFSKSKLPAHPLLMDVHGWSIYVTVFTTTRVFWLSKLTFTASKY